MSPSRRFASYLLVFAVGVGLGVGGTVVYGQFVVPAHQIRTTVTMQGWRAVVDEARDRSGEYPATLAEAVRLAGIGQQLPTTDSWGNQLYYERVDDGFVLTSFGTDKLCDLASPRYWRGRAQKDESPCFSSRRDTVLMETGLVRGCTK